MRYTKMLIPTLRETPAEAEVVSHQLMMRAGYIRKVAAGVYTYLPLCLRVLRKIERIVRQEMEASGAQELLLPVVMPAELWIETGRWAVYGKELLRFRDRHDRDFCIGPTHEEAITDLIRNEIRSWRDLPKNCFQIQTKFRDEVRPRFGLMRGREFIMKDGYSFDRDEAGALASYEVMYGAYKRIFTRCGLSFRPVEAMTGSIGGSKSHEFQVLAGSGEDEIVACNSCEYAANVEKAELKPGNGEQGTGNRKGEFKKVATPGQKSVEEVCGFLKVTPEELVKTLIFDTDQGPIAGLVRGDHTLKEAKLKDAIGVEWCNLAEERTVAEVTKAPSGFAGPVGLSIPVYADYAVAGMEGFVVGANEADAHLTNVSLADFKVERFLDIRRACAGDRCPRCEGGVYEEHRGIEVGQVFFLGTKYSEAMKAVYADEKGEEKTMVMGCYGIGISRTAAAAIEQNHDERGMIWPLPIAPYHVEVIPLSAKGEVMDVAEKIHRDLEAAGVEVVLDDRDERAGVKFADADLIGIPYRIIVGEKGLKDGVVELKERRGGDARRMPPDAAVSEMKGIVSRSL
ncbi:MAG TPA: proline--tRNA ligase [bacterium]|nr:proline--tRNA ligase [bacterium]